MLALVFALLGAGVIVIWSLLGAYGLVHLALQLRRPRLTPLLEQPGPGACRSCGRDDLPLNVGGECWFCHQLTTGQEAPQ
jgi:hypothetical protein